jgi:hypothetical protein
MDQRRGDALGALGHGVDWLTCGCDNLGCTAAGLQPSTVIVHVITHQESLSDDTPTQLDGKEEPQPTASRCTPMAPSPGLHRAGRPTAPTPAAGYCSPTFADPPHP